MRQAYASVAHHYISSFPAVGMLPRVNMSTNCIGMSAIDNLCIDVCSSNTFTFERYCSVELHVGFLPFRGVLNGVNAEYF